MTFLLLISVVILNVVIAVGLGLAIELTLRLWHRWLRRKFRSFRYFDDPERDPLSWNAWGRWSVRYQENLFALTVSDVAAIIWLKQLIQKRRAAIDAGDGPVPLVRFRREFQRIISKNLLPSVLWCLASEDSDQRRLSVFLLGLLDLRGNGRYLVFSKTDADAGVRKEVARALRRKAAMADLCSMAQDPDVRVRRIVASVLLPRPAYTDRLGRFSRNTGRRVPVSQGMPPGMRLFLREPIGMITPPKTRSLIRQILERIRELVRSPWRNHPV